MRKNKNKQTEQTKSTTARKKKNEMLSSVLSESVLEALLDEFAENKNFVGTYNGETAYIGLLFDTNDVGGISKKTNKDEGKGSFVEQVKSGRIKALITPELLADDRMVIVPDAMTIDSMSEFSMLDNVVYKACWVMRNGTVIVTNIPVQLSDVVNIIEYDDKAEDIFFGQGSHYFHNNSNNNSNNNAMNSNNTEELSEIDDFDDADVISDDDFASDYDDIDVEGSDVPESLDSEPDFADDSNDFNDDNAFISSGDNYEDISSNFGDDFISEDSIDDSVVDEVEDETEAVDDVPEISEEISDEQVKATIVRKFYSDDLGLEITSEPFDLQFMHNNIYVPFAENRGDGWLNEYLNNMSIEANAEMKRLHETNLFSLREKYLMLMGQACDDIQKRLDIYSDDTGYGKRAKNLKLQRSNANDKIDSVVTKRKTELEDVWTKKLDQVGEDAARMARQQYRERFGDAHNAELYRLESDIQQEIENEYQDAVRQMNTERRDEASKQLDISINATLAEISNIYADNIKAEQDRYNELQQNMLNFIESNKQDEVTRIATLKEEQERASKAQQIMQESTERINQIKAEFEASRSVLQNELENSQRENEARLRRNKEDYDARIAEVKAEKEAVQKRLDDLTVRFADIDKEKEREYNSRIKELTNEKAAWQDKCADIMASHKRQNTVSVFLVIVSVIAAIAIGIIAGYFVCSKSNIDNSRNNIVAEQSYITQAVTDPVQTEPITTQNVETAEVTTGAQTDASTD